MLNFIFQMQDINLFILLSLVSIVVSVISITLIKVFIPIAIRYKDNSVIGNTGALISVIYGVLAGLSALYLINNNSYAADAVQREANAVADIYRDSKRLQEPMRSEVQAQIKKYILKVINDEWIVMSQGKIVSEEGLFTLDVINELLEKYQEAQPNSFLTHDMLNEIKNLYDARQQRIFMSYSALSPEIWVVILIGTILTLCINYLFGMNFYLHIVTVIAAALMTSSMIFLLITLDKPFQGEFIIEPDGFRAVLKSIEHDNMTRQVSGVSVSADH